MEGLRNPKRILKGIQCPGRGAKLGSLANKTGVATQLTAKSTGTMLTSWREVLLERLIFAKLSIEIPHLVWNPRVYFSVQRGSAIGPNPETAYHSLALILFLATF